MFLKTQIDDLGLPRMLLKINEFGWFARMYLKTQEIVACGESMPQSYTSTVSAIARIFMKANGLNLICQNVDEKKQLN